jgi:site-specific recombinase XerD
VRWLLPEGVPLLSSAVNADWLTAKLTAYPAKRRNTTRKVHSSWSGFFDYLVLPKKVYAASPMLHVQRPALQRSLIAFYDTPTTLRVVQWQPTPERRALFALIYGAGADVSPAITVEREDFNPATHEVRIAGTKTGSRDRVVRISDTMWPIVWAHVRTVLSGRVFPETYNRWTVSDWHRWTVGDGVKDTHGNIVAEGIKLKKRLPVRKARHHFAVRLLQAGAAVRVVAEQLGSDERTVLKYYGPWITSSEDRARAEQMASDHETKRRDAK